MVSPVDTRTEQERRRLPGDANIWIFVLLDLCSFRWGPQVGLVYAFGGGRGSRERRPPREHQPAPEPASNPLDEAVPPEPEVPSHEAPPPSEAVAPQPEPDPTTALPEGAEPGDSAPPTEATEPEDLAPPPSETTAPQPPTAAPGSTDVPLPPQTGKIAPPR